MAVFSPLKEFILHLVLRVRKHIRVRTEMAHRLPPVFFEGWKLEDGLVGGHIKALVQIGVYCA